MTYSCPICGNKNLVSVPQYDSFYCPTCKQMFSAMMLEELGDTEGEYRKEKLKQLIEESDKRRREEKIKNPSFRNEA